VLKPVALDGKVRGEVDELTGLLKDNLENFAEFARLHPDIEIEIQSSVDL